MFTGIIQTKDILRHPLLIMRIKGIRGFFSTLRMALSRKPYRFIECIELTGKHHIGRS